MEKETKQQRKESTSKRKYVKPKLVEVWNERIGLKGAFLLEM
jgi:hypothetical protein